MKNDWICVHEVKRNNYKSLIKQSIEKLYIPLKKIESMKVASEEDKIWFSLYEFLDEYTLDDIVSKYKNLDKWPDYKYIKSICDNIKTIITLTYYVEENKSICVTESVDEIMNQNF